jgi:hypothetical protein
MIPTAPVESFAMLPALARQPITTTNSFVNTHPFTVIGYPACGGAPAD